MSEADNMRALLEAEVVPALRTMEFKGSFPHFHRVRGDHVDLLWFTFGSAGESFAVELSYADSARANVYFHPETPPERLRVSQTTQRHRLGVGSAGGDFWFAFVGRRHVGMSGKPPKLAAEVRRLLSTEGEEWWRGRAS